ncbi:MAG: M48 family metallopeptidase, partial [Clostridia bacterium]|nr:M48 family metallopeptidase [Clostridia bacterium]
LLEMNHSKRFYERVERVFPRYKECRKWLVVNGGRLLEMLPD